MAGRNDGVGFCFAADGVPSFIQPPSFYHTFGGNRFALGHSDSLTIPKRNVCGNLYCYAQTTEIDGAFSYSNLYSRRDRLTDGNCHAYTGHRLHDPHRT